MNNSKKTMNIVLSSDENYTAHMAATIMSLCVNNSDADITVHILDGGITEKSRKKIEELRKQFKRLTIRYYAIGSEYIKKRFSVDSLYNDRSLATYSRLFIPEILGSEIERVVYLDVDAIVTGNLSELFTMKMDYPIYGVKDVNDPSHRLAVGLKADDNYVCAGMLLFDLVKCREINIIDSFIEFIRNRSGDVKGMDQGTINGTLKGNIGLLHPKYDVLTPFYTLNAKELCKMGGWKKYYSQTELDEAIRNPVFIHFTPNLSTRPWQVKCRHPRKSEYIKYRALTPFPLNELDTDKRKFHVKILGFLYYHLPYSIYYGIYSAFKKFF